jgi:hypothetical protein
MAKASKWVTANQPDAAPTCSTLLHINLPSGLAIIGLLAKLLLMHSVRIGASVS